MKLFRPIIVVAGMANLEGTSGLLQDLFLFVFPLEMKLYHAKRSNGGSGIGFLCLHDGCYHEASRGDINLQPYSGVEQHFRTVHTTNSRMDINDYVGLIICHENGSEIAVSPINTAASEFGFMLIEHNTSPRRETPMR